MSQCIYGIILLFSIIFSFDNVPYLYLKSELFFSILFSSGCCAAQFKGMLVTVLNSAPSVFQTEPYLVVSPSALASNTTPPIKGTLNRNSDKIFDDCKCKLKQVFLGYKLMPDTMVSFSKLLDVPLIMYC
jgi:hypothetical protein